MASADDADPRGEGRPQGVDKVAMALSRGARANERAQSEGAPTRKAPRTGPGLAPPREAIPRQQAAIIWVNQVMGPGWRELLHNSHELAVAEPLLFCRVCGHYAPGLRYLGHLKLRCDGPPLLGSTAQKRLKRLLDGREHPETRAELGAPVSLPPGPRS